MRLMKKLSNTLQDIRDNQVDVLTLGQYLRPTINHLPIERWYSPKEFNAYKEIALEMVDISRSGFRTYGEIFLSCSLT